MILHCIKLSPTGNVTLLVTDPVPRARHAAVAAALLARVGGEQAGFVEPASLPGAQARLQMMGGEFCGNATMSLGAVLARSRGLDPGGALALALEVSGSDAPVSCVIRRDGGGWLGTVDMPLPTDVGAVRLATDAGTRVAPLVRLPGIAHAILPADAGLSEEELRRRLPAWNRAIGADALGALIWDAERSSIDPLVCVPSAGTLVREHGCGSGSAAVGAWLALAAGESRETAVRQPGGTITVNATVQNAALTALSITGRIEFIGEAEVQIDL